MKTRLEADSIGILEVPADAYYGVQSFAPSTIFPLQADHSIRSLSKASSF